MASIPVLLTAVDPVLFRSVDNLGKYAFIIEPLSSILLGSGDDTGEVLFEVPPRGRLTGITVSSSSEDYDISLRTINGLSLPSVKEIYQVSHIDTTWAEYGLEILYINDDVPLMSDALYFFLTNNDAGNEISTIEVTLFIMAL